MSFLGRPLGAFDKSVLMDDTARSEAESRSVAHKKLTHQWVSGFMGYRV